MFYCHSLILSDCEGVPEELAALQAEQLRGADALAQACRRMHALLRAQPLPLQLSFRVPLRAAALHALLAPEQAGRIDALHLWGWDAPLSEFELEQLLGVLRNQANSLRRLALEGHPAALLGTPGVDLRCLHQLTKLELSAAKALQLVPATMPQGLVRMVCTMDNEKDPGRHITWATNAAGAPPGCLPHLDWMHMRISGPCSLEAAFARPGVHVRLTACGLRTWFTADPAPSAAGLRHGEGRSIFHTARSVSICGYSLSVICMRERQLLPELFFPITGSLTEFKLDPCFPSSSREYAIDARILAFQLQGLISAREAVFAFKLTGIAARRPALAVRRWPRAGTRDYHAAAAAHAQTRAWAWSFEDQEAEAA